MLWLHSNYWFHRRQQFIVLREIQLEDLFMRAKIKLSDYFTGAEQLIQRLVIGVTSSTSTSASQANEVDIKSFARTGSIC